MSTSGVVIVDEQDPSVVFTGQWDHILTSSLPQLADPVQYKGFATGSQTAGTTCSLNFTGSSVVVVTTVVRDAPFSLQFNLDGTLYSNSSTGITNFANVGIYSYHDSTFTIGNLSEGNHVLTISTSLATTDIGIFIDYFLYTPSSQTNLSNLNLFIDDRDPSLQYAGNWRFDTADSDFRHTSRAADDTSLANVTIPFTGDGIQFYGLINNGSVGDMLLAEFVLDGTSTTTYAPPAQTSDITYNNKLYDSGTLPQKSHKLVVTPKNGHLVWLDYVLVHQAVTTQATHTSSSSTSIATSAGASTTGPTMVPVTTFNHRSVNVGAIVGGVIGGVALILLLILGLFLLRRKQRNLSDNRVNEQLQDAGRSLHIFTTIGHYSNSTARSEVNSNSISYFPYDACIGKLFHFGSHVIGS
ncbi:hypothetical protein CPB84DRAFT_1751930 [Gymnopilus junonius]|uniref:Transmembrane protein n=1 Tax=Gymnopilus junonius TaxID=109634 RepID=A0A9P5NE65_GYMJU|nr:hypothetical protein CPB84DRAFT_1751930 [Gymnopilus junonius]